MSLSFLAITGFVKKRTTPVAGEPTPPAITGLAATPSGHNINLVFVNTIYEINHNNGYDQIDIYRKDNLTNTYALLDSLASAPVQAEIYQDPSGSGLVPTVVYTYKLQGTLAGVLSAFSNEASATAA